MLTQSFATLLQPTDGLFDVCQRKVLRSERNHGPQATGSRAEELPSHDVPCTVRPRLLSNVRLPCSKRRYEPDLPSPLGPRGRRWIPGTGYRVAEASEREFPSDEAQLAYRSGRKTASSCSRGTAPTSELRVVNEERES